MYCGKCGAEIPETAAFCPNCGAGVNPAPQPKQESASNAVPKVSVRTPVPAAKAPVTEASIKKFYILVAVLSVLELILWFTDTISTGAFGLSQGFSLHGIVADGDISMVWEVLLVFAPLAAAAVFSLLPVLQNSLGKRRRMILPILASAWNLFLFVGTMISASSEAGNYYGLASVNMTFFGILDLLAGIAAIVLSFMVASKSKALSGK